METNNKNLISILVGVALLAGLGYFVYSDLDSGSSGENATTTPETTATTTPEKVTDEVKYELPKAPIPSLDRPFSVPNEYSAEIKANTMKQYESLVTALKANPELRNEWLQLALLRKTAGDLAGAEQVWIYVSKVWPLDHVAFGNLADLYTNYYKEYKKGEEYYIYALAKMPNNLQYYENLYNIYKFNLKDPKTALELMISGYKDLPTTIYFPVRIAEHYRDAGDPANAKKYFEEALVLAEKQKAIDIGNYIKTELAKLK
jgi:tetratricopeptide (TPR) repeat protein